MGRFDDRATQPSRGPRDLWRWKVWDRLTGRAPRRADWKAIDAVRPGLRDDGAAALAAGDPVAVWLGHATWALRLGAQLVVTDPVFGRAGKGAVARLVPPGAAPGDPARPLPPVDVVTLSHDHMDHMDLRSLRRLGPAPCYVVPVGNGPRLAALGLPRVVELDWWQSHTEGALTITLVPARHWAMRMPWTRNETLWGGFVIRGPEGVAYHAGDTAYGPHFAEIAARCGPIDWAMLPIGAYAPRWFMAPQHMNAEEAGRAFVELGARHLLAMHWGTFRLTDEAIGEPPEQLRAWVAAEGIAAERIWIVDVGEARALR
jgi:L-ascorbate metabolism protein UlaG (beta-lactamase superfamily)